MTITDAYAALGLTIDASPAEVYDAYRELSKRLHPDAGGTAERFSALGHAYRRALADARSAPCPDCKGTATAWVSRGFSAVPFICAACRDHPGRRWPPK